MAGHCGYLGERHSRLSTCKWKCPEVVWCFQDHCAWSPVSWGRIVRNLGGRCLLDPVGTSKEMLPSILRWEVTGGF